MCGIAPELQENVLHDLFGGPGLLQDSQNEAIDGAGMAIVKLLEGAHIPLKKPVHQRHVERHFGVRRGYESREEQGFMLLLRLLLLYTA